MSTMESESLDAVVSDPPYGLEFQSAKWDTFNGPKPDGDVIHDPASVGGFQDGNGGNPYSRSRIRYGSSNNVSVKGDANGFRRADNPADVGRDDVFGRASRTSPEYKTGWQAGGGFSNPGIGARHTDWPSFSATSRHGAANPTCAECGGRLRGAKKCSCEQPHDHWKDIGKRRNPENEGLPSSMTGSGLATQMNALRAWHVQWVSEVYRVLAPGGVIKAFGGTRTFQHLAHAMETAGFEDVHLEGWCYASGFPKSHSVGKALDRRAGATRQVIGMQRGVGGENMNDIVRGGSTPVRDTTDEGGKGLGAYGVGAKQVPVNVPVTAPATPEAVLWEDWGTALKPAWEPVVCGRKPLS